MSPPGCQKMLATPCNQNAEESFPVHSLKSQAQKPPNPLLIQDKNILQPSKSLAFPILGLSKHSWTFPANAWLCTKNRVIKVTLRSLRPIRPQNVLKKQ